MLIVGIPESEIESALKGGAGPGLPPGARCPACGGELGRWGSYRRWARRRSETHRLRIARALCHACGRTHALLPSFLYARRTDIAEMIFGALEMAAAGRGHRPVAAWAGVPEASARGWLRRARQVAEARPRSARDRRPGRRDLPHPPRQSELSFQRDLEHLRQVLGLAGWLGGANFGGRHDRGPGEPEAFELIALHGGGFYAVPPAAGQFPGADLLRGG